MSNKITGTLEIQRERSFKADGKSITVAHLCLRMGRDERKDNTLPVLLYYSVELQGL